MLNIDGLFWDRVRGESGAGHADILEHMPLLRLLASQCEHVTEFGVRTGNSTIAFLAGLERRGGVLESYDIGPPLFVLPREIPPVWWAFHQADTSRLEAIAPTDLLFVDTLHTYEQVRAELVHADKVRKYLVFHDTVLNGEHGEGGQPGILRAIGEFLESQQPAGRWRVLCHMRNSNGLMVLERTL